MAAVGNNTFYYISENKVYEINKNESSLVWDSHTVKFTIPVSAIEDVVDISNQWSRNYLEGLTKVEFSDFYVTGIATEPETNNAYAIAYANGKFDRNYQTSMEMIIVIDLNNPQDINKKILCYSGYWGDGLPNSPMALMNGENIYYDSNTCTYCLNMSNNRITKYGYAQAESNTWTIGDGALWYIEGSSGEPLKKFDLTNASDPGIKVNNDYDDNWFIRTVCFYGADCYYWTEKDYQSGIKSELNHVSLVDLKPQKLISYYYESTYEGNYSPKIIPKDNLPFEYASKYWLWTADANGNLYFFDKGNSAIRKLYGA